MITTNNFGISAKNKKQTISFAGGTNLNISNAWLTTNGWDGKSSVILINTGQIISSTTATAALIISATMPSGRLLQFVNNGGIYGKGGTNGGQGGIAGTNGGLALSVQSQVVITNNSPIAGGGGGGGCAASNNPAAQNPTGGKGADQTASTAGNNGWNSGNLGFGASTNGNSGADAYGSGTQGVGGSRYYTGAGLTDMSGNGGGGAWGSSGGTSGNYTYVNASYAGYGAFAGGAGGAAVNGNTNIIWAVTGNRYGAIS